MEWTTISKTKKPAKNPESKPLKYTGRWTGIITKKDITLSEEEKEMVAPLNIFCNCCQTNLISDVIRRSFFSCGTCYCCVGDDPTFDNLELCGFTQGVFRKYNDDYHYTNDDNFYKN
jgi:hypothetical protein